jgi:hypothetical protein
MTTTPSAHSVVNAAPISILTCRVCQATFRGSAASAKFFTHARACRPPPPRPVAAPNPALDEVSLTADAEWLWVAGNVIGGEFGDGLPFASPLSVEALQQRHANHARRDADNVCGAPLCAVERRAFGRAPIVAFDARRGDATEHGLHMASSEEALPAEGRPRRTRPTDCIDVPKVQLYDGVDDDDERW